MRRRARTHAQTNGCASYDALDPIVAFHTYGDQDGELHGVCDDAPDWLDAPRPGDPVGPMAELVTLFHAGAGWDAARPVLERAFNLAAHAAPAGAGRCFELQPRLAAEDASTPRAALAPGCAEAP